MSPLQLTADWYRMTGEKSFALFPHQPVRPSAFGRRIGTLGALADFRWLRFRSIPLERHALCLSAMAPFFHGGAMAGAARRCGQRRSRSRRAEGAGEVLSRAAVAGWAI